MRPWWKRLLAPVVWVAERLGTSQEVHRNAEEQAEVDKECEGLALYLAWRCPYGLKVKREITRLGLAIEERDVRLDPDHRRTLEEEGGKFQTPCLRIREADGGERWLYESEAIIDYLRTRFF
ncbi:glutaredoxin [Halomonas organivorans]